ncbi:polyphosphate kinase 2 family protein [Xanthomarina sp. F1114]|uniref:PPK2 family polyphosphate kinase n=1 Tax=Xanthomarina sp. F1114 TaxID=2996019 RepID=UPI00225DE7C2|nr:PPK2 family polyphosphate kinase [Xanthomarina sp. F1114]MCX7547100.1 polyphosphate kinase 2 family protein [Xanthomarina sp. F1114]
MKKIKKNEFQVKEAIEIKNTPTAFNLEADTEKIEKKLGKIRKKLAKLQDTMYAHGKYSVLVCLQGMDTAGKDSLIREVFKDLNARGVVVHSFKVPTSFELKHDYLWRHYIKLPPRGKIGVFNRTHYENVLVTRVHPEYILNENLPEITSIEDINETFWDKRFEQINNFEKYVAENGTIILKFFLNLSKDEQKHRLLRRLEKEDKNWKFSPGDLAERKLWDDYQVCYQDAINRTSKAHAPWFAIPADDKPTARYLVAKIIHQHLKEYKDIKEPELDDEVKDNLKLYKKQLESE